MGNRAVITKLGSEKGIYLHWNGGMDSVKPIVWFAHNFIKDEEELDAINSVCKFYGLNTCYDNVNKLDCDNYDNGVYLVDNGEIIGRVYNHGEEQDNYDFNEFVCSLNESMPKCYRQDKEFLFQYLSSYKLNDKWGDVDKDAFDKNVKVGSYIYVEEDSIHKASFVKILGVRKSHELINGVDYYGKFFYNFTKRSSFGTPYDDKKDIEKIENNPNSYLDIDFTNGYTKKEVRVLDQDKYEKLKKESESWED